MRCFFWVLFLLGAGLAQAQTDGGPTLLAPADTFHQGRFWTTAACGAAVYTGVMIGLNEAWYADHPRSGFHFFNDWGEWQDIDKIGHSYTTYFETAWSFQGARWTGLPRRKALWLGAGLGMLYQTSVEMLDGFSQKWGFSVYDMAFNTLGAGLFVGQELLWEDQRILLKFSSCPKQYDDLHITNADGASTSLQQRVDELYGTSLPERLLKDYNGQTLWASFNLRAFAKNHENNILPKWLNLAVGYGGENMYGGFENKWTDEAGNTFELPQSLVPRYRQFFLSPDIDLTRIPTKSPLLKTLLFLANALKVPAPALEINTRGKLKWWWVR